MPLLQGLKWNTWAGFWTLSERLKPCWREHVVVNWTTGLLRHHACGKQWNLPSRVHWKPFLGIGFTSACGESWLKMCLRTLGTESALPAALSWKATWQDSERSCPRTGAPESKILLWCPLSALNVVLAGKKHRVRLQ